MKKLIMTAIIVLAATTASQAATEPNTQALRAPSMNSFTFKYTLKSQIIDIQQTGANYEEAYELAAFKCFEILKGQKTLTEDQGLDVIDACANPR